MTDAILAAIIIPLLLVTAVAAEMLRASCSVLAQAARLVKGTNTTPYAPSVRDDSFAQDALAQDVDLQGAPSQDAFAQDALA